ncbi:MAG: rhomboid family intramembrane serine protease [Epulopiscium sp. Nuni2H_MBin003]|nr:MAG: rhomboid family intramembrane serine protease [Epulopiscium sp. Nuni2H_MBin003]
MFKISFNSPIILGFSITCALALISNNLTAGFSNDFIFSTYRAPLNDPMMYVRLIGHVFGHADWDHFIGNMMLILVVGPLLEEKYGSFDIFILILITAILTGLANNLMFAHIQLLGASGVAFALILLSSFTSIKEGAVPMTFILVTLIYIVGEIYDGLFMVNNISNVTHIIGGATGATLGYLMNKYRVKT